VLGGDTCESPAAAPSEAATHNRSQLLKLAGVASGGADAKAMIASGRVTVNGEPELGRGRQLHPGDIVDVGRDDLRIVVA
jgi:ribosome-associated protein